MGDEQRRHRGAAAGVVVALAMLFFYFGGYPLFGTRYDRPPVTIRAFASEIAWAYWPLGKMEAMIRRGTVEFHYHSELPARRGEPHVIRFAP